MKGGGEQEPPPAETLGQRLLAARRRAVLSQRELAARAGLDSQVILDLEHDRRVRPYPSTVRALAAALGMPVQELAGEATARPSSTLRASQSPLLDDIPVGLRLRRQRLAVALSQVELARASGVSDTTLRRLEQGRHQPGMATLQKIAGALGCSLVELLGGGPADS